MRPRSIIFADQDSSLESPWISWRLLGSRFRLTRTLACCARATSISWPLGALEEENGVVARLCRLALVPFGTPGGETESGLLRDGR